MPSQRRGSAQSSYSRTSAAPVTRSVSSSLCRTSEPCGAARGAAGGGRGVGEGQTPPRAVRWLPCVRLVGVWSEEGRAGARGEGRREERVRRRLLRLCARVVDQELCDLAERVPLLPRVDDQPAAARLRGAYALLDAVDEPEPAGARVGACARKRRGWRRGAEASRDSALDGGSSARRRQVLGSSKCLERRPAGV